MTIYNDLGVRTLINARGGATLAGGTLMEPEVVAAMAAAAESFVRIADLQEVASRRIAALTGAEAGYVTSGAAAGLTPPRRFARAGRRCGTGRVPYQAASTARSPVTKSNTAIPPITIDLSR